MYFYLFPSVFYSENITSKSLLHRLPIRKYDPNLCFAVGDDTFDSLADEGIVIRQGAIAENGEDNGEVLFPAVVLSAPLLHSLQALTEIVLFLHQGFQFRVVCAVVADGYRAQEVGKFAVDLRDPVDDVLEIRLGWGVRS